MVDRRGGDLEALPDCAPAVFAGKGKRLLTR